MIELGPAALIGVWDYVGIKEYISGLSDGQVDVVNRDGLKPFIRPIARTDAIYASDADSSRRWLADIRHHITIAESFVSGIDYRPSRTTTSACMP
nr:hypothetical protein [uncultured Rhodopila sp.]